MRVSTLVFLGMSAAPVLACPFHSAQRRLAEASEYTAPQLAVEFDTTKTSTNVPSFVQAGASYASYLPDDGKDWCYWSTQSLFLPPANLKRDGSYECTGDCTFDIDWVVPDQDAIEMWNLGQQANQRFNALAKSGGDIAAVWSAGGFGKNMWTTFCKLPVGQGPDADTRQKLCPVQASKDNTWIHPLSTLIMKIRGPNVGDAVEQVKAWRTGDLFHGPALSSDLFKKFGYGFGGTAGGYQVKLLPCEDVPARYLTPSDVLMDGVDPDDGQPYFNKVLEDWGNACGLTADDPTREKCKAAKSAADTTTTEAPAKDNDEDSGTIRAGLALPVCLALAGGLVL